MKIYFALTIITETIKYPDEGMDKAPEFCI